MNEGNRELVVSLDGTFSQVYFLSMVLAIYMYPGFPARTNILSSSQQIFFYKAMLELC